MLFLELLFWEAIITSNWLCSNFLSQILIEGSQANHFWHFLSFLGWAHLSWETSQQNFILIFSIHLDFSKLLRNLKKYVSSYCTLALGSTVKILEFARLLCIYNAFHSLCVFFFLPICHKQRFWIKPWLYHKYICYHYTLSSVGFTKLTIDFRRFSGSGAIHKLHWIRVSYLNSLLDNC